MKVLDLFSGIGGFALGLEAAGFETVAFCEIDPYAQKVLKKNWPGVPIYEDVRRITADRLVSDGIGVDVITGGFPCQDISVAGHRAGITAERSGLWSECARLLGDIRPSYAIFENVTNLLNGGGGIGLSEFYGTFPRSGMMRSGTVYQLPRLAPTITEIGSGLWHTPKASDYKSVTSNMDYHRKRTDKELSCQVAISENSALPMNPVWVEWLMGFPLGHTDLDA